MGDVVQLNTRMKKPATDYDARRVVRHFCPCGSDRFHLFPGRRVVCASCGSEMQNLSYQDHRDET